MKKAFHRDFLRKSLKNVVKSVETGKNTIKMDDEKIFKKSSDFWLTLRRGMAIIIKQSFLDGSCLRLCWNW